MAYELDLPIKLTSIHSVFHVSMHKKCIGDPVSILPLYDLGVKEDLSYEEVPVEILYCQVKILRNKEVASVKVLWRNHLVEVQHGRPRPTQRPTILIYLPLLLSKVKVGIFLLNELYE